MAANAPTAKTGLWGARLIMASFLGLLVFVTFPQIDMTVSALFAAPDMAGFALARHPALMGLNDFTEYVAITVTVLIIVGLLIVAVRKRPLWIFGARQLIFLGLSLGLGPGLLTNGVFKEFWGRARPRSITQFGGSLDFSPAGFMSDQCSANCSFISGDASLAFAMLALALIAPRSRPLWITISLLFGAMVSLARIAQGAHFLSDTLFAGLFMTLIILVLHMLILEHGWTATVRAWRHFFAREEENERRADSNAQIAAQKRGHSALWFFFRSAPSDLGMPEEAQSLTKDQTAGTL